jgi:putative transposase
MQMAPSGYRHHAAQQRNPELRCGRAKQDEALLPLIHQVWQSNMQVYGADKVWHQLRREGVAVARCTVERLMQRAGARSYAPRLLIRPDLARWTGSIGNSRRSVLISFGCRTSPMFRPGKAGNTWPL